MAELNKVSVDDLKVTGKRVLVRVDFNVPMKDGVITNDNRIQAALPTINKLVSEGAKVILCSHLGKPKNGPEEKFSLKAAAARLAELVSAKVTFVPSDVVVDDTVRTAVDKMQNGEIVVLENTRFRKEETKNIESFSKDLASIADAFVMDAFGSAHRAHCSTVGVTEFVKETAVGYLMQKEIKFLGNAVENPVRPFVAILGGAKVADKLNVISKVQHGFGEEAAEVRVRPGGVQAAGAEAQRAEGGNPAFGYFLGIAEPARVQLGVLFSPLVQRHGLGEFFHIGVHIPHIGCLPGGFPARTHYGRRFGGSLSLL